MIYCNLYTDLERGDLIGELIGDFWDITDPTTLTLDLLARVRDPGIYDGTVFFPSTPFYSDGHYT